MYKNAPVVYRSSELIRDLIIDWVERHKTIPTQPDNNWRDLAVALAASAAAVDMSFQHAPLKIFNIPRLDRAPVPLAERRTSPLSKRDMAFVSSRTGGQVRGLNGSLSFQRIYSIPRNHTKRHQITPIELRLFCDTLVVFRAVSWIVITFSAACQTADFGDR